MKLLRWLLLSLLLYSLPSLAQVVNYPVDDERRNGSPEKLPPELQFIGFTFHRFTGTNIAPQNELLRGQIIGRLYGENSTITVPQTAMYGESRFVPLFVYRPSILDGKAIFRSLLKVDFTWGDVNYGVGNNFGGAISGGTVNIQTLLANVEVKPSLAWNLVIGLQRIFDNPRDPNVNTLLTNQTSANRLMFWGTQGVGISSYFNLSAATYGRVGVYQLYENLIDRDDDVVLWMADMETKISGLWDLGGSFWYLWDRGAGQGGVSILGQGFNSTLVAYNGGARLQLNNPLYKANVFWTGFNTAYNKDFIGGRLWASAMGMMNFGHIDTLSADQSTSGKRVDILGVSAHASLQYKYGQTANDKIQIEAIFTSGDGNGATDGKYNGVVTGNTWGSPVGIYSSHRAFLLFPDVQVINRYYSAVHDISNLGYGVTGVFFNYFNAPIPNKLHFKIGSAAAWATAQPFGGGNFIGTEVNAEIKYTYALFFDIGLSAAYLWNGDFYNSTATRNSSQKPTNAWTLFTTVSWLMF
ncbi:MAG: hypothetical protein SFU91_07270 [Chloroherpetonaceae bacterium]|nr:hypothetical protein [Chloroherpetonaceae bacterium]